MTTAEKNQLDAAAHSFAGQHCAGDYRQLIYPVSNETLATSMITELGVEPQRIFGVNKKTQGRVLKHAYRAGAVTEARFVLQENPKAPIQFQYYRSTHRNGGFVVTKQVCRLR